MNPLLEVKHLNVDLNLPAGMLHAVRDVSFSVQKGKTLSLVGESGCGKSMIAMAIMGLLPPSGICTAEKIAFEGQDLLKMGEKKLSTFRGARMAMIFQEPMTSLDPCYTIGNQLVEAVFTWLVRLRRIRHVFTFRSRLSASPASSPARV